jgi:hypothetical protein
MKSLLIVAVCALAAIASANIINPTALFDSAQEYQEKVGELQREINFFVTSLRIAVTDVLRASSNATLAQIDSNLHQIFELDRTVRDVVFGAEVDATPCINSLRTRLNAVTEFSGFEASVCVARHDRNLTQTLSEINGLLERYGAHFNSIQMIVVRSFVSRNIWTQSEDISSRFVSEYERNLNEWHANGLDAKNIALNLSSVVEELDAVLAVCFEDIRIALVPVYDRFGRDMNTCREFDNTRLSPLLMFKEEALFP